MTSARSPDDPVVLKREKSALYQPDGALKRLSVSVRRYRSMPNAIGHAEMAVAQMVGDLSHHAKHHKRPMLRSTITPIKVALPYDGLSVRNTIFEISRKERT